MDSLFSLEVIINFLKLNPTRPSSSPCLFPTIAFRLLDYPIIAVSLLDKFDADQLKSRLGLQAPFESIDTLPCFTEMLDSNGRYMFNKGKSCLFRADTEALRVHLTSTPMYMMILDTFYEPYKLLGTLAVPLTELIEEICEEIDEEEIDVAARPSIKMSHGVCDVRNLMGHVIGHVSFVCRLTFFGKSIIPHLIDGTKNVRSSSTNLKIKFEEPDTGELGIQRPSQEERSINAIEPSRPDKTDDNNTIIKTVPIDYQETRIELSGDLPKTNRLDKATQSPHRERKLKVANVDENFLKQYRPPSLFFNSELDRKSSAADSNQLVNEIKNKQNFINFRMEYLNIALKNQDFIEGEVEPEVIKLEDDQPNVIFSAQNFTYSTKQSTIDLNQMPLLKHLFDEISQLKRMLEDNNQTRMKTTKSQTHQSPKPKPRKQIGNYQQKQSSKKSTLMSSQLNKEQQRLRRERINESVSRLSQPKSATRRPAKSPSRHESPTSRRQRDQELPERDTNRSIQSSGEVKAKKPPLKYGLTNAFKMRMQAARSSRGDLDSKAVDTPSITTTETNKPQKQPVTATEHLTASNEHNLSDIIRDNLERILQFESTGSLATNISSIQSSPRKPVIVAATPNNNNNFNQTNNNSTGNLTLLNRVDMESTMDTMNFGGNTGLLINTGGSGAVDGPDAAGQSSPTKMVQFGHTYVYDREYSSPDDQRSKSESNTSETSTSPRQNQKHVEKDNASESSSSSSTPATSKATTTSTTTTTTSAKNVTGRNIFLMNRQHALEMTETTASYSQEDESPTAVAAKTSTTPANKYDDDFHSYSSLESSSSNPQSPRKKNNSASAPPPKTSPRRNLSLVDFFDFNYDDDE